MTDPTPMTPDGAALRLVVEKLRLIGYACFWFVVLTGVWLTKTFGNVDLDNTLLVEVFGYNNICVYFDFSPSNRVLPFLWAITLVFLLGYIGAQWLHMRADVQRGWLGLPTYRVLTGMNIFEAVTLVGFSTIFAVTPEGWDASLYIHTVPFFLLQFGMVSLAISNTIYGIRSGYWRRLEMPWWFNKAAIVYCIVFTLVVGFKIPYGINAMAGQPWWQHSAGLSSFAGFVDFLFLMCAAAIPMAKAAYLLVFRSDKIDVMNLTPRIAVHA